MKKTLLLAGIIFCSISCFSQKKDMPVQETPTTMMAVSLSEERIVKLETEIRNLKTEQSEMKKQLSELQSALPPADKKKKKLVINRAGSKQVSWSSKEVNEK